MTGKKIYLVMQTIICILLVLMLSVSAVKIYREGAARRAQDPMESIYSPQNAAEALSSAAPLLFAGLGMLAAGLILGIKDEKAEKPVRDARTARDLAVSRVLHPSDEMKKEQAFQKKLALGGWAGFLACMIPILLFLADPAHFPEQDPDIMFRSLLWVLLPWTALGTGVLAAASSLEEKSFLREMKAARQRIAEERAEGILPAPAGKDKKKQKNPAGLQAVIVVAAVLLIIAGSLNGSARDVLVKAVTICTECVGLG